MTNKKYIKMESLVGYESDEEYENRNFRGMSDAAGGGGGSRGYRAPPVISRDDDTNYDDVTMDMSEDSNQSSFERSTSAANALPMTQHPLLPRCLLGDRSARQSENTWEEKCSSKSLLGDRPDKTDTTCKGLLGEKPHHSDSKSKTEHPSFDNGNRSRSEREKVTNEREDSKGTDRDSRSTRSESSRSNKDGEYRNSGKSERGDYKSSSRERDRGYSKNERDRDREKEREKDRDREREKDKDREREKERDREKNKERDREKDRDRDRERVSGSSRGGDRDYKSKERDRHTEKNSKYDKDRHRSDRDERDRKRGSGNDDDRKDRDRYRKRSRSRSRSREKSHNSSYGPERTQQKMQLLEKLGIEIQTPDGMMTPQALMQKSFQEQQDNKGVALTLPKYYNPGVVNPLKYVNQMQKRKLLWSKKPDAQPEVSADGASGSGAASATVKKWGSARFAQDTDGKVASKFMRLMGIKDPAVVAPSDPVVASNSDVLKEQEEMFSSMEAQYEVARTVTHTMRGMGLGFGTHARQY